MTRRLRLLGLLPALALVIASCAETQPDAKQPNILLIVADDMGYFRSQLYRKS
jgi:hypothetical protein